MTPPEPKNFLFRCPVCNGPTNMEVKYAGHVWDELDNYYSKRQFVAFECVVCHLVFGGALKVPTHGSEVMVDTWWPKTYGRVTFPDVPNDLIASMASEAYLCRDAGALRGAVGLARAVIEATAKHYGITEGKLWKKIEDMAAQQLIRARLAEAAHVVRDAGNDVLHGDLVEAPTEEAADDVLELMHMILDESFGMDSRTARLRKQRMAD